MKTLKKLLIGFFTLIVISCLTLFLISLNIKEVLTNMVSDTVVTEVITSKVINTFENNLDKIDSKDLEKIEEVISNNEDLKEVSKKLIDSTILYLIEEESIEDFTVKESISDIIKKNKKTLEETTGYKIKDSDIENIITDIDDRLDINQIYQEQVTKIKAELTPEQQLALRLYNTLTSKQFKIIMLAIMAICLSLIAILKKSFYKWITNLTTALIVSGTLVMIFSGLINLIVNYAITTTSLNIKINSNQMLEIGLISLISGIIIIIIYQVIKKILQKPRES